MLPQEWLQPEECECWPQHWEALQTFLGCDTQWRVVAGPKSLAYQGLEYPAIESVMRMRGVSDQHEVFEQVKHIERGALELINRS